MTNGTNELFTILSDSTTNILTIQYLLISSDNQFLQQTTTISDVPLGDGGFHHIAVAVYNTWLTVIVDGEFRLRREFTYPDATEADNIYVGTLNEDQQPTFQGEVRMSFYIPEQPTAVSFRQNCERCNQQCKRLLQRASIQVSQFRMSVDSRRNLGIKKQKAGKQGTAKK